MEGRPKQYPSSLTVDLFCKFLRFLTPAINDDNHYQLLQCPNTRSRVAELGYGGNNLLHSSVIYGIRSMTPSPFAWHFTLWRIFLGQFVSVQATFVYFWLAASQKTATTP